MQWAGIVTSPPSPEQGVAAANGEQSQPGGQLVALGRRLRQAREAQGLQATVLADRLRIGVEQLEALEAADRQRLPEPVFVIAQARRVAGALQLDISPELQALRSSGELQTLPRPHGSRPVGGVPVSTAPAGASDPGLVDPGWKRPGQRRLLAAGGALLLFGALWAGWRLRSPVVAADPPQPQAGSAPAPVTPPAGSGTPDTATVAAGMVVLASPEPSWVEVRRSDGAMLFRGLLRGARLFPLEPGLEVMAARPDLVTSRIGSAPAQPLGPISEVRWRSLAAAR